jgi:hypothetical protein
MYWQGYNWDTTSWVNQPPEPPNIICDNKKCKWIGMSEDRVQDEEYDNHCPNCNGTDFSWIDYDPMTAEGRNNREQFCKGWDPIIALDRLVITKVEDGEDETEVPNKAAWPF